MRMQCIKRNLFCWSMLAGLSLGLTACNTTKATVDTTVNFFSSTSPNSMLTRDGKVEESQKVNLFAGVAYKNLQHDAAQGSGQYLTSLATLLKIPSDRQADFGRFVQSRYPVLFTSDLEDDHAAHLKMLAVLDHEMKTFEATE